jgi:hypothetical protein
MDRTMATREPLLDRLRHELREYAIVAVYLYVCFAVLLLGEAAGIGSRFRARNLLIHIARKIALFLALLIVLTVIEELIVGLIHGRTAGEVAADFESRSLLELTATCLYMLLVLTPYIAVRELSRALGPGTLRATLFAPPGHAADGPQHEPDLR